MSRESTKCRLVYLANLSERNKGLSQNQCVYSGPNLNQKLTSALLHLRFDKFLLCFDLAKAFNQIELSDSDASRLLFLWYKDILNGDNSLVAFSNIKLLFGCRCSPFLLMIALYYILVIDSFQDEESIRKLKILIYAMIYMDNGAVSSESETELLEYYKLLPSIFSKFKFTIQQVHTNSELVNCQSCPEVVGSPKQDTCRSSSIKDPNLPSHTEFTKNSNVEDSIKLLGIQWEKKSDTLSSQPLNLNASANTKRSVLSSLASCYDPFNFSLPLMNKAKLFMQSLQTDSKLGWDTVIDHERTKQWKKIAKEVNMANIPSLQRYLGPRTGDYELVVFTDSSSLFYGTVIYLKDSANNSLHFVLARNRVISKALLKKSIPSLEMAAVAFGVATAKELYEDLSGESCMIPINIKDVHLFTDSLVCLHWLRAANVTLDKMSKTAVFVMNRISKIQAVCNNNFKVKFHFIAGKENPADLVTRCPSGLQLEKSNFWTGPRLSFSQLNLDPDQIVVPNPNVNIDINQFSLSATVGLIGPKEHLVDLDKFAYFPDFTRYLNVCINVRKFFEIWKSKALKLQFEFDFQKSHDDALVNVLRIEQEACFHDIFNYFKSPTNRLSDIPPLMNKLNVHLGQDGLLRVKSRLSGFENDRFPILLPNNSKVTDLLVLTVHYKLCHAGIFSVLQELRKNYFMLKQFSQVKRILKTCIICHRFHNRPLQLNTSPYRPFRQNPPEIPFASCFMDHMGPFKVTFNGKIEKIYILNIACNYSRAVNLIISFDLTTSEFLRNFQQHVYRYGIPSVCISDPGSSLVAGTNVITSFLNDYTVHKYLTEHHIQKVTFTQFFKGNSSQGAMHDY